MKEFFTVVYLVEQLKKNAQNEAYWSQRKKSQLDNYWDKFVSADFADYKKEIHELMVFGENFFILILEMNKIFSI